MLLRLVLMQENNYEIHWKTFTCDGKLLAFLSYECVAQLSSKVGTRLHEEWSI